MIVRTLLVILLVCSAQAVLNKDLKRREAFDHYGPPPPRPSAQYGPPPSGNLAHRGYGVPQNTPFRDYGPPPPLKYGPSKLNFVTSGSAATGYVAGNGLHEQIKNHFGVSKPFYGPPHIQHKPSTAYGPPKPQYELLQRPILQYGPPLQNNGLHSSKPNYRPLSSSASSSSSSISLPNLIAVLNPSQRPASSYGPPPSGPLHQLPQHYGPPRGPSLPNFQQTNKFHGVPETTIIVAGTASDNQHGPVGADTRPIKQVQIQVDSSGHTHSVAGSQAPFHTSCEGWKPIAKPTGTYVEHNHIEQQTGYSQVSQANIGTHYHAAAGAEKGLEGTGGNVGGNSIINGLTDEQLVAVALQAGKIGGSSDIQILTNHLSTSTAGDDYKQHSQNSIESNELHTLGTVEDSYSRPPPDSYAPGSIHAQKYTQIKQNSHVLGLAPPSGNYGPPLSSSNRHSAPLPFHQPSTPVAFRPPVPQGLIESIGSTVQHLDQFGVKPPNQPPTYIPPAANEAGHTSSGNLGTDYAAPLANTHIIFEQQLPNQIPPQTFLQYQQQSQSNINTVYGIPSPQEPILGPSQVSVSSQAHQYLPPPPVQQSHNLELSSQQYVPPPPAAVQQPRQSLPTYQHSLTQNHLENAYSSSQNNEQFAHVQGLPVLQIDSSFHQVHDCGNGPNLIGTGYQAQQHDQQNYEGSTNSFNAIAPSIPVGEQHSHFITGPSDSYGPPPSGSVHDHIGLTSQKTSVNALPDGTDPQTLPGLDGLNVISAQKSQSIQLNSDQSHNSQQQQSANTYQLQFGNSASNRLNNAQNTNHDEILSDNLLQSILTAIEQSNASKDEQQLPDPRFNQAQSRSDQDVDGLDDEEDKNNNIDANTSESNHVPINRVQSRRDGDEVTKLKAIAAAEEDEEEGKSEWNAPDGEEEETSNH